MLDVGLTGVVQIADPEAEREIEAEGLMARHVDWRRFPAWRYQIDVDGNSQRLGRPVHQALHGFPGAERSAPDSVSANGITTA